MNISLATYFSNFMLKWGMWQLSFVSFKIGILPVVSNIRTSQRMKVVEVKKDLVLKRLSSYILSLFKCLFSQYFFFSFQYFTFYNLHYNVISNFYLMKFKGITQFHSLKFNVITKTHNEVDLILFKMLNWLLLEEATI